MTLPLTGLAILLTLSLGAGYSLSRLLPTGHLRPTDRIFLAAASGLGLLSILMAILGALGLYSPAGYFGAFVVLLAAGIPGLPAAIVDARSVVQHLRAALGESRIHAAFVILILLHGAVLLFAAFSPVYGYDALDRHLCVAKEYLRAGGFVPLTYIWGGDFPNQGVMLYTIALVLGDDRLAQITNVYAVVCGALGTFVLARPLRRLCLRLGASLVVISLPTTTQYMASPYVDVYVQVWLLAMWFVLENYASRRNMPDLLYAGILGGLAAAVKFQGCIAFASLLALALFWLRVPDEPWRRTVGRLSLCAAAGSIPVGFWLAKSTWLTGNPVYPLLYSLFGGIDWSVESELAQKVYLGSYTIPLTPLGFFRAMEGYLFNTTIYMGNVLGPFFLFGLFVPVSPTLRRRLRWISMFGLLSLLVFFHFTTQIRYIFHAVPFLAISAVAGVGYALDRFRSYRVLLLAIVSALYAVNFVYATALVGYVAGGVLQTTDRHSYLVKRVKYYDAYQYVNENVAPDAGILIPRSFGYYLDRRFLPWHQKDQGVLIHRELTSPSLLEQRLSRLDISYVIEYDPLPYSGVLKRLLRTNAELIYKGPLSSVYFLPNGTGSTESDP